MLTKKSSVCPWNARVARHLCPSVENVSSGPAPLVLPSLTSLTMLSKGVTALRKALCVSSLHVPASRNAVGSRHRNADPLGHAPPPSESLHGGPNLGGV